MFDHLPTILQTLAIVAMAVAQLILIWRGSFAAIG